MADRSWCESGTTWPAWHGGAAPRAYALSGWRIKRPSGPAPFRHSSIARQPSGAGSLRQGCDIFQQRRAGIEPCLISLVRQFSPNRGKLAFGLCNRGYGAAHLRDQFVKGRGVQFAIPPLYPGRGSATPKISIAEKVDRKLTAQATRSLDVAQERLIAALLASPSQTHNIFSVGWPRHLPSTSLCGRTHTHHGAGKTKE
jgi:hypothetical protein